MSAIRTLQVIYGYFPRLLSRKTAERFILIDSAQRGFHVPHSPIARFWCRLAPDGSPAKYMIGWTAPTLVQAESLDSRVVKIVSETHECDAARGALVH